MEDKKSLLKEYFDSVQSEDVKKFMEQCVETIPEYWFKVPASSTGKYHPNYALGEGGLLRHTIALLRFFNRLVQLEMFSFTEREKDLLRVACLMHDSRKSGSDDDFARNKYTKFDHPMLAANVVRGIETSFVTIEEKAFVASVIESHMGQWNVDQRSGTTLPKPITKHQNIVHLADYLAATKGVEVQFEGFTPETPQAVNESATLDTFVVPFGKFKGKKLTEIASIAPDYISWAKMNITSEPMATLLKQL